MENFITDRLLENCYFVNIINVLFVVLNLGVGKKYLYKLTISMGTHLMTNQIMLDSYAQIVILRQKVIVERIKEEVEDLSVLDVNSVRSSTGESTWFLTLLMGVRIPPNAPVNASVIQWIEIRASNPKVAGSIPARGTSFALVA